MTQQKVTLLSPGTSPNEARIKGTICPSACQNTAMQHHCEVKKAAAVGRDRLQSPGALALAGIVPVLREWAAPADAYRGHRLWESDSHLSGLHFVCWLLKPQNAFVSILYWYKCDQPEFFFFFFFFFTLYQIRKENQRYCTSLGEYHRDWETDRGEPVPKCSGQKKKQEATCTDGWCSLSRPVCGDNSLIHAKAVFSLF